MEANTTADESKHKQSEKVDSPREVSKTLTGSPLASFRHNLDGVESKLHAPTASTMNGAFKAAAPEEEAEPVLVCPIADDSHLLKATSATKSAARGKSLAESEQGDAAPVTISQISEDSHLLKSTQAARTAAWTEEEKQTVALPIRPIDPDSRLLSATSAVKASEWIARPEERVPVEVEAISPDSSLLRQTSAAAAAAWTSKEVDKPIPVISPLSPGSPLLRVTKSSANGVREKADSRDSSPKRAPAPSSANSSPVSRRLVMPTKANLNGMRAKVELEVPEGKWDASSSVGVPSVVDLPPMRSAYEGVDSRLMAPTTNTVNSAYKPKARDEDEDGSKGFVNVFSKTAGIPEPPPLQATSLYKKVESRLQEPTASSVNSSWKFEETTAAAATQIRSISPESNLLRTTTATASASWSPKQEAKKVSVVSPLSPDSRLMKETTATAESKWSSKVEQVVPPPPAKSSFTMSPNLTKPTAATSQSSWSVEKEREAAANQRAVLLNQVSSSFKKASNVSGTDKVAESVVEPVGDLSSVQSEE